MFSRTEAQHEMTVATSICLRNRDLGEQPLGLRRLYRISLGFVSVELSVFVRRRLLFLQLRAQCGQLKLVGAPIRRVACTPHA